MQLDDQAIPFSLQGTDNQQYALSDYVLSDYADKVAVAVIFSCNHCPYVLAWEHRMMQIQADYADQGVQLVLINANDAAKYPTDSFPNMQAHAAEKGFNFPYLHDETQEVAAAYGATRTPEAFLFDSEGLLRYHGAIDDNYEEPSAVQQSYLRDALDAVLAGSTVEVAYTTPVGCTIKWK